MKQIMVEHTSSSTPQAHSATGQVTLPKAIALLAKQMKNCVGVKSDIGCYIVCSILVISVL